MYQHRIDIERVENRLRKLQTKFPEINKILRTRRDSLTDEVVENMLAGYAYINALLEEEVDILRMGELKRFLELNYTVLCGTSPEQRRVFHSYIERTEERFYDTRAGGIRDIVDWYERHPGNTVWERAAGVYIRILSTPQLYIEGNHRAGSLVMSYLLVREGKPPFILTTDNARAYFDPSTLIKDCDKAAFSMLWKMGRLKKQFAKFLEGAVDANALVPLRKAVIDPRTEDAIREQIADPQRTLAS